MDYNINYNDIPKLLTLYHTHKSEIVNNFPEYYCRLKRSNLIHQTGGMSGLEIAGIGIGGVGSVLSSIMIPTIIFIMFMTLRNKNKCPEYYELTQGEVSIYDVISNFIPMNKINYSGELDYVEYIGGTIQMLSNIFSVISPTSGMGVLLDKGIQIVSGIALDVVTAGAGGDMAVNLIYTIRNGVNFTLSIINMVIDLFQRAISPENLQLVNDVLSIDFEDGPMGVECRVKYIMAHRDFQGSFLCEIFRPIYPKMVEFIGAAISASMPDTAGIPGVIITRIMQKDIGKNAAITMIINKLTKQYNKIPKIFRRQFQDPELLRESLETNLNIGKKILLGYGDEVLENAMKYINLIAYILHKLMAITFAILHILKGCSVK